MKENGFSVAKERSRRFPTQTITDEDYADDITLLTNTPAQDQSFLHILEGAAAGIDLHVNADKTEYMCFNQISDISTQNGCSLKLVDKFIYPEGSVSSTETDINRRLAKVWKAIDGLSVIWETELTDKIKRSFFQAAVVSILLCGWTIRTLTKHMEKKLDANHIRMLGGLLNKSWRQHLTKSSCAANFHPSRKLSKLDEADMSDELMSDILQLTSSH